MLIAKEFPDLSHELRALLSNTGDAGLVAQISELKLIDRCRCGDDFCATIYTQPKPTKSFGPSHRNIPLSPTKGMIILDVVENNIACIEILYRDEIRKKLLRLLP